MRLALVTETFPPEVNGVAMTLNRLVSGLRGRGHVVTVIRPKPRWSVRRAAKREPQGRTPSADREVHVLGCPIPGYPELQFGRPAQGKLRKLWERARPDAVHVATEGPLGLTALWAARELGIPVISTYHTNFAAYGLHSGYGWFKRQVLEYFRYFHNRTAGTLVPSETVRNALEAAGFERVDVLARGVDTDLFSPQHRSAQLRQAWGVAADTPVIAYVGRIAAEKNLPLTIDAFLAFREKVPQARMVLVGDGPLREQLQRQHPEFHFAGMRHGEDLAAHYASADGFFFASETETFGNVVTEAMASGLFVLAYDYAAAARHITDGQNGFTVSLGDREAFLAKARQLAEDADLRSTVRAAARKKAETLGWSHVVDRYEARLLALAKPSADTPAPAQ